MNNRWLSVNVPTAVAVLLGCYAISIALPVNFYGVIALSAIPITLLTGSVARADLNGRRGILGHPVSIWLGNISFAFYIFHLVVLDAVVTGLMVNVHWTTLSAVAMIFALLAFTILLAWVVYSLFEKPLLRLFSPKTWYKPQRAAAPAMAAAFSASAPSATADPAAASLPSGSESGATPESPAA
jgi:peptidoglycan/LPS O-acetylase OafA/YrhL